MKQVDGYTPGKQPQSRDVTKLNTNENPYPPSEAVMEALGKVLAEDLRRYPLPFADAFREQAARAHGVEPDQIIATNGGDELLRLSISTYVEPGEVVGVFEPSYSLYPVLAGVHGSPVCRVELGEDWARPTDAAARFNDAGARLVFLVNPHAPSGSLTPVKQVRELAEALDGVLLIDEAYVDFVDPTVGHDVVPLIEELDNLLLLRTLSKGYSLAGLRFGYGLGAAELIDPMRTKTRDSYNVDAVSQQLACAALAARDAAASTWQAVRAERERLREGLRGLGFSLPESQSNFLLAQVPEGQSAALLARGLEDRGVLVRHFPEGRLENQLRITVGTPAENARLLEALEAAL